MRKFDPIPRLQQIAATIEESGAGTSNLSAVVFDAPATAVHYINCAIKEIERLRKERDEARRELCAARRELCRNEAIIRLQRNRVHRDSEDVVGLAKEIAVERGWDCFKDNP